MNSNSVDSNKSTANGIVPKKQSEILTQIAAGYAESIEKQQAEKLRQREEEKNEELARGLENPVAFVTGNDYQFPKYNNAILRPVEIMSCFYQEKEKLETLRLEYEKYMYMTGYASSQVRVCLEREQLLSVAMDRLTESPAYVEAISEQA